MIPHLFFSSDICVTLQLRPTSTLSHDVSTRRLMSDLAINTGYIKHGTQATPGHARNEKRI